MRGHRHRSVLAPTREPGDDVASPAQLGFPANLAEPIRHPLGAFLLEESWRWDPAQLQMLLVDPSALLAKPIQTRLHISASGEFGDRICDHRHANLQSTRCII